MKKIFIGIFIAVTVLFSKTVSTSSKENNSTTIQNKEINTTKVQKKVVKVVKPKPIKQVTPTITISNMDAVGDDIMLFGYATPNLDLEVVLIYDKTQRIVLKTKTNDVGSWAVTPKLFDKELNDGVYDIYVSTYDKLGNKSKIAVKKSQIRDKSISGKMVFLDTQDKTKSDKVINKLELKKFIISGSIDKDAKIIKCTIANSDDLNNSVNIKKNKLRVSKKGLFSFTSKDVDISSLKDGIIIAMLSIQDKHANKKVLKATIKKDTTPPSVPVVTQKVKNGNMIYGKVANMLVFAGVAEVGSTIEAVIFNKKYPSLKTIGKVVTPPSTKWVLGGKDFNIADLKDGTIVSILTQIDKAGNRSKSIKIVLQKQRPAIFPTKVVPISPENYMPIFTIKDVTDKVKSIVVSKDYIIAGSFEFLYYFDKRRGNLVRTIEIKDQWVNTLTMYENKLILGLSNGDIQIREKNSGKLLKVLKAHSMAVLHISVDLDLNRMVSSSANGTVIVWDIKSYKKLYIFKKHQWDVAALAIKDDKLYTGSDDYTIKMWDLKTGKLLKSLKSAHSGTINALVIYKNMLISASDDKMIFIRDLKSGRLLHILKGHKRGVTALKINHDMLVSASKDRTLILWDLHTFRKIKQLRGHSKTILSLDINDENIVTGAMDYKIRIWGYDESLQGQGEIDETTLAKYDLVRSLDISSDIVTSLAQTESDLVFSTKGYIFFYNNITYKFSKSYSTFDKVHKIQKKKKNDATDDEWADDTEDTKNTDDGWADDGEDDQEDETLWEIVSANAKQKREAEAKTSLQWIYDIDIQGPLLTAGLGYKNIKIWDMERNSAIDLLEGHDSSVLDITRGDGIIVSSSKDGTIKVWNDETYEMILSIDAHQWDIKTVAVDDTKIYSGSDDYSIKMWDKESGDLIKLIKNAHNDIVTKILLVDNNILISSGLDGYIIYRDKESGKVLKRLSNNGVGINTLVNDDEHLVSGDQNGVIKVWDLKSGKLIKTMSSGHKKGVTALMITDDYIISGAKDKKINIWKYYE